MRKYSEKVMGKEWIVYGGRVTVDSLQFGIKTKKLSVNFRKAFHWSNY